MLKGVHARFRSLRERTAVISVLSKEGLLDDVLLVPKQRSDKFRITGLASYNMIDIARWRKSKGGRVFITGQLMGLLAPRYLSVMIYGAVNSKSGIHHHYSGR